MTPLDDELRSTLSSRAAALTAPPEPLAGIEARAARIRRRRAALAVSGAVVVVAAVALAVPALVPNRTATVTPATTPSATASASATPTVAAGPGNLLGWGVRGRDATSPDTSDLRMRFARELGRTDVQNTMYDPLYVDQQDGVAFTMGQVWFTDQDVAYTVSYAVGPDNVPQFHLGPVTPKDPWGLAFVVNGIPTHQLLVVVPGPAVGQVSYAPHATGAFTPTAHGPSYGGGVLVIQRDLQASDDRLQVLDGNGNLDQPLYEGPVTPLLCDLHSC
jgi:hypothetical protein